LRLNLEVVNRHRANLLVGLEIKVGNRWHLLVILHRHVWFAALILVIRVVIWLTDLILIIVLS